MSFNPIAFEKSEYVPQLSVMSDAKFEKCEFLVRSIASNIAINL